MDNQQKFYSDLLFSHSDYAISSNIFKIENFFMSDKWGCGSAKIRLVIQNYKSKMYDSVILDYQHLFQYLELCREYVRLIPECIQKIQKDNSFQKTINLNVKKKIYTTLLFKTEYGGSCIRIVLSDKSDGFLDSEKVYMPVNDFMSFCKILVSFRDNYVQQNSFNQKRIQDEKIIESISELSSKISNYYLELKSKENIIKTEQVSNFDLTSIDQEKEIEMSSSNEIEDMEKYVNDNFSNTELDLPSNFNQNVEKEVISVVSKNFTNDVLNNDMINLEILMMNIVNNELPLQKISEYITEKMEFDVLNGFSQDNIIRLNYLISCYLKMHLRLNIEKKEKLPQSTLPIILDDVKIDENKISLVYDIFLYMIYLTQIRNSLQDKDYNSVKNKDLFSFILKMVFSPLVFSYICKCEEKTLISELVRRYKDYRSKDVFKNFESKIQLEFGFVPDVSYNIIESESQRIYTVLKKNHAICSINSTFSKYSSVNCTRLKFEDFNNNFTLEQIKKIILLELNYQKNQKIIFSEIEYKDFFDVPSDILKYYGVSDVEFDNTNLKRVVKDFCKNKENLEYCLNLVTKVKGSYFDLKNEKFLFEKIPEEVLKSIYLWDLEKDRKVETNYNYFLDLIKNSSLEKDLIISILTKIDERKSGDFIGSFQAAKEDF